MYTHIYIYMYMYTHTHTYIYIYIYIYTHTHMNFYCHLKILDPMVILIRNMRYCVFCVCAS